MIFSKTNMGANSSHIHRNYFVGKEFSEISRMMLAFRVKTALISVPFDYFFFFATTAPAALATAARAAMREASAVAAAVSVFLGRETEVLPMVT